MDVNMFIVFILKRVAYLPDEDIDTFREWNISYLTEGEVRQLDIAISIRKKIGRTHREYSNS